MARALDVLICGPLAPDRVLPMTRALLARWPFLRLPAREEHRRHVMLASVRRTFARDGSDLANELHGLLDRDLPDFVLDFPRLNFALLSSSGGSVIIRDDREPRFCWDPITPLAEVGFEGEFKGFEPDYFGAEVDPYRFLDCLPEAQRASHVRAAPPTKWLAEAFEAIHGRANLSPIERGIMAALDREPESLDALHVLADAGLLVGDPRAELLGRDLSERVHGREPEPFVETELEREIATLASAPTPHHLTIGEWMPRLWVQRRGPWLIRLVVRTAVVDNYGGGLGLVDEWQPWGRATLVLDALRGFLEQPCSRYLSERRVTLLACPIQPDLSDRDLSGFDFQGIDFQHNKLRGARFDRAVLAGVAASHVDLVGASLVEADLRRADLRHANLENADLRRANLEDANLCFANLRGAHLDGARLDGVRWTGSQTE